MRLERLAVRGFRNLDDLELEVPAAGLTLLGDNGQGKTNLLEAIYYPVLFRSFHGAVDQEVVRFGGNGFRIETGFVSGERQQVETTYQTPGRRKRVTFGGVECPRLADGVGRWLAVAFLPEDLRLASGPASERRRYLDRMLSLADRRYLVALGRYRAALAQRNAALRQGRPEIVQAFDRPLAAAGSRVVASRLRWAESGGVAFEREMNLLGTAGAGLHYMGNPALADEGAWPAALARSAESDLSRGATGVGPHRDDLRLQQEGHELRAFGSTGQQRTAAIALKLLELETLEAGRQLPPALLLDDVFSELDRSRQERLADRLRQAGERQVFLSSPRADELPGNLDLPVRHIRAGALEPVTV